MPQTHSNIEILSVELRAALPEQSFGIDDYQVMTSPFDHARINLLEDSRQIYVIVTEKGWQFLPEAPNDNSAPLTLSRRFETLNDLLRSSSPMYAAKEMETLLHKLQAVKEFRDQDLLE